MLGRAPRVPEAPTGHPLHWRDDGITAHHPGDPGGQFDVVWQTKGPIRAQPWSPFIEGNEGKQGL